MYLFSVDRSFGEEKTKRKKKKTRKQICSFGCTAVVRKWKSQIKAQVKANGVWNKESNESLRGRKLNIDEVENHVEKNNNEQIHVEFQKKRASLTLISIWRATQLLSRVVVVTCASTSAFENRIEVTGVTQYQWVSGIGSTREWSVRSCHSSLDRRVWHRREL